MTRRQPVSKARYSRGKLWCFRLLAIFGIPLALLCLFEVALRLLGYGYATGFFVPATRNGQVFLEQNPRFGWRFFGQRMARVPAPCSFPQAKEAGTIRIFVFGESAAFGDPQPQFGLARMLQAMLSLRYPNTRFEVINTAMTAINSHVIRSIACDCASVDGDIWVIYAGNNEVVGPFGAGTVFGPHTPALPLIRASIALKGTRTGQLLDSLGQRRAKSPSDQGEWGGMTMFLDQQVPADAPEMNSVYQHFERNLADILDAGLSHGAGVVVSTVAVNLRDCAPFASAHRPGLSESDKNRWEDLYKRGADAQTAGNFPEANARLEEAAKIDDRFAELRFRQAECALALGAKPEAQQQFEAARDLDTLRFRCDTRLTEATRQVVSNRQSAHVLLADAARDLAAQGTDGVRGANLFYDHVHLTFECNYLVARSIAMQVERLLPSTVGSPAATPWPTMEECAHRLGWTDWSRTAAWEAMLARFNRPPFTSQLNHATDLRRIHATLQRLSGTKNPASLTATRAATEQALTQAPNDPLLLFQLASLQQTVGDLSNAVISARRSLELLPPNSDGWFQLGVMLGQLQNYADAVSAFRQALELDSQNVAALENLGHALEKLGKSNEAVSAYREAVRINPRYGPAWLSLGEALEAGGQRTEAQRCFEQALANRIPRAAELSALARFCQAHRWLEAAATNYADALNLSPGDARLHLDAGVNLDALGRRPEATAQFAEAVRLAPEYGPARFLLAVQLARAGDATQAIPQFTEAVRLMPDLIEARLNLALALMHGDHPTEALTQFNEVLKLSPTNEIALRASQTLQAKLHR